MIRFAALNAIAPDGSIIGVLAEDAFSPVYDGVVVLGPGAPLPESPGCYILEHALARAPAFEKARAASRLLELRRKGSTIVLISHDEPLLEACADEIWWLRKSAIVERGDPGEVLFKYHRYIAARLRESASGVRAVLAPALCNGDGRASLDAVELLDERGESTAAWRSGENATIRVKVRFAARIEEPVIGIMIRTRIGLNVYGTNTELEGVRLGTVEPGRVVRVLFRFACNLCPGEYTVTAASHDPDGVWHHWMEDAVAFSVTDSRYTAGVANLRARVWLE